VRCATHKKEIRMPKQEESIEKVDRILKNLTDEKYEEYHDVGFFFLCWCVKEQIHGAFGISEVMFKYSDWLQSLRKEGKDES